MNTYTVEKIKEILALHKKFWNGEAGGKRADLRGADLRGAYLQGAKYGTDDDTELMVNYFCVGPIGSRSGYLQVFHTNKRIELKTGCFAGSVDAFETQVLATHGENKHGKDYVAAIAFVRQMTAEVSL